MYGYLFCPVIAFDQNSVSSKFCNSGQPEFKQCLMILMTGYFLLVTEIFKHVEILKDFH
jgi:hypothetical protein